MSSGFISQNDINKQDDHREENEKDRKWREAYERLNNDDSSKNNEYTDSDKNKSLAEIMSERKQQKYQELEDKSKFSNQFRGIDSFEATFLNQVEIEKRDEIKRKRDEEDEELNNFKKALKGSGKDMDKDNDSKNTKGISKPTPSTHNNTNKKKVKGSLKGVIKKK